jgi:hypothetical protein
LVGSSEAKKVPGLVRICLGTFYRVFELPSPRNAQKRDKKKPRKNRFGIFCRFCCKALFVVLLNPHRQEAPENTIKQKKSRGKTDIEIFVDFLRIFSEKVFDMDFLQKYFYGVFELPLPRNAQNVLKKKSDGGWVGMGFSKCMGGSVDFVRKKVFCVFLNSPCYETPKKRPLKKSIKKKKKMK